MSDTQAFDIVVPVFNEAEALPEFLQRVNALRLPANLVFVDNASTDGTLDIIRNVEGATVIEHATNEGYGASLVDGMLAGKNKKIIIIDVDCEYPPEAIPELLSQLDKEKVVYTSRFLGRQNHREAGMPWLKMAGNKFISGLFNRYFDQHTTDLYTGCKAYHRECVEGLDFKQKGFEHVLELAAKFAARKYRISEIAVDYRPRQTGQSKMSHITETIKYLYLLQRYARLYRAGKLLTND
jgi:glycosyltransferase involved in cell wall biosynthesis